MKVIIIEGCDNTGKTTLISNLVKHYSVNYNVLVRHCGKPIKCADVLGYQTKSFINEVDVIAEYKHIIEKHDDKETIVIYDRFVQGEYVWGHLYRNYSIDDIKTRCVAPTMNEINEHIGRTNVMSILLDAPTDFIINNDDGKSFASDYDEMAATAFIEKQRNLFYFATVKPDFLRFDNYLVYDVTDRNTKSFKDPLTISSDIISEINKKLNID